MDSRCPFCCGVVWHLLSGPGGGWWVCCDECGAIGPRASSQLGAIEKWGDALRPDDTAGEVGPLMSMASVPSVPSIPDELTVSGFPPYDGVWVRKGAKDSKDKGAKDKGGRHATRPAKAPAENCGSCRFWGALTERVNGAVVRNTKSCLRHAPAPANGGVVWPETSSRQWCGDWEWDGIA